MHRFGSIAVAAVGAWLLAVGIAHAQQGTGELRGRVDDQQNAVLPGVTVVAKNEATGMFREIVSGADGSYFMSALTPGTYELSAQLTGFKKYQRGGIRVEVGKTVSIDVQLEVGGIESEVTVSAVSPLVDVTSKEIGGTVQLQELNDIPSMNRNFTSYLGLLPGVIAATSTNSFGADDIRINGQSNRNVNYAFDGAGNNDSFNAGSGGSQARVPVEAVQEFQLLTSQFDAEFGSTSGGIVNAVSKQGTNALHGTAFFFDQNQRMTALDYFAAQQGLNKPETRQLQWGGNLGGPIVRNKLHFFANLERIDQNRGITIQIPARPELNFTDFTHDNVWNWMVRVDHQISSNHTWAVRWLRESSPQTNQYTGSTNWTRSRAEQENDVDWTMVGTLNSVLKNTTVNTLRLSYTHEDVFFGNPQFFENGEHQELLKPTLQFLSFQDQQSARAQRRNDPAYQLDETLSWFLPGKRGDHDVKFGTNYVYNPLNYYDAGLLNGRFVFSQDAAFDASNPRTYPERLMIRVPAPLDVKVPSHFVGMFAQDKWKANNHLTVSVGVRYDLELVPIRNVDNPRFSDPNDHAIDKNNVSPRLGASWVLDRDARSVIRGGWGLFYQKTPLTFMRQVVSDGAFSNSFQVNFPANNADSGPSRGVLPTDPFLVNGPVVDRTLLNLRFPAGAVQKNGGDVFFDNPDRHLPYSRQASIGFERQIADDVALSADYIHSDQRDLYMRRNLNPGTRASTTRTATVTRIDPNFVANVWEIGNYGWINYNALQMSLVKRFRRGYSGRVSYTLQKGWGNTDSGNNDTIETQVGLNDLNLNLLEGPTSLDRRHLLSIDGSLDVPHTGGLLVSGVVQAQTGAPFTLLDTNFDQNRNGVLTDEFLPAGAYNGVGADSLSVDYAGGRRGAHGPGFFVWNLRAGYKFRLPHGRLLQAHFDVFNLTNYANFDVPTQGSGNQADKRSTSFLTLTSIRDGGPTRTAQFNLKYSF